MRFEYGRQLGWVAASAQTITFDRSKILKGRTAKLYDRRSSGSL